MAVGTEIDAVVFNSQTTALTNRARGAKIRLRAIGYKKGGASASTVTSGLGLRDFGMTDISADVSITGFDWAVTFDKSFSGVGYTPNTIVADIRGSVQDCTLVSRFMRKVPGKLSSKSRITIDLNSSGADRITFADESGWDYVTFGGKHSLNPLSNVTSVFALPTSAAGWRARDLEVCDIPPSVIVFHATGSRDPSAQIPLEIDWHSCKFFGGSTITSGAAVNPPAFSDWSSVQRGGAMFDVFRNYSNFVLNIGTTTVRNLLIKSDDLFPVGKEYVFFSIGDVSPTFTIDTGVTVHGAWVQGNKVFRLYRTGINTFVASSS